MKRSVIVDTVAALLILLFVYAAISKLLDYSTFKNQLEKSPFITLFAGTVAWSLPAVEIITALFLLTKPLRLIGLYLSLFLMSLFTLYIYAMLHYSYYIPCSCGGILSKMSWTSHLWFNLFFVVISIASILIDNSETSNKAAISRNLFGLLPYKRKMQNI